MSLSDRFAAIPCITAFLRFPDLKSSNCLAIYCEGMPAMLGLAEMALIPSRPWQATHTAPAICCPRADNSALVGATNEGSAFADSVVECAKVAEIANITVVKMRFITKPLIVLLPEYGPKP